MLRPSMDLKQARSDAIQRMVSEREPIDQRHKAHTSPTLCQICVRLLGQETKKDSRPIVVSPYAVRCAREDLNLHDRYKGHQVLSLARLPIPPLARKRVKRNTRPAQRE